MKRSFFAVLLVSIILALAGCGGDGGPPPKFNAQILSDPTLDGDIEQTGPNTFLITQGMVPPVQSVFAGLVPGTSSEFRAFLDFPLRGPGGIPTNAVIDSAFLDLVITSIQPSGGTIPIRIELVSFPQPMIGTDFDRTLQPPLTFTTIIPPISQLDVGQHVAVDVTPLMAMAQRLGLANFQVRILEDLGIVAPGNIEINDTTDPLKRGQLAPLLDVTYF